MTATGTSTTPTHEDFNGEYPFRSHFLDLDGVKLHYLDEGEGDPLLMIHGNPTWSFVWRNFIRELSPEYRAVAVDHVGCGYSDKPQDYPYTLSQHIENLSRLIEHLDLKNITLVAHDWGGAIGMGAAVRRPDRFARLVLMNTAAFPSKRIPLRIALCRLPLFGPLAVRGLNLFARAALRMAVSDRERLTPAVCHGYLAPYDNWQNRVAILRFVRDIPLSTRHQSYATLKSIADGLQQFRGSPVLLPWGMRDWCFDEGFLREFQRCFPQAEPFEIPDAGHYLFEGAHEKIIHRLREFLKRHPL